MKSQVIPGLYCCGESAGGDTALFVPAVALDWINAHAGTVLIAVGTDAELLALEELFPPPSGYAVFPEELEP